MREFQIVPADDFVGDRNGMAFGPLMVVTIHDDGRMVAEADGVETIRDAQVVVGMLEQRDAMLLERIESFWSLYG